MRSWIVAIVLAWLAAYGHAQPPDAQPGPQPASLPEASMANVADEAARPWADGVSEARQARALELYVAGNVEFKESRYGQALAKYREAIQHWDHPAIRFNMAVCLIHLDQLLEAKENLDRSLAYGDGPLGADMYAEGITYRKLLNAQLAHVWIRCEQHGAQVTLDGKLLFTGPGSADVFLLPGDHQVVVAKDGFLTQSKTILLAAGSPVVYDVRHLERKVTLRMARRWDAWKPWGVISAGIASLNAGVLTYVVGGNTITHYENAIARCSEACTPRMIDQLEVGKDRGEKQRVVAVALLSAGAAAVAVGVVGVVMNQPRLRVEPSRVPSVAHVPGGAMVVMSWGF
jgi:tetratricopeptide (TPR) repeat protein